MMASHQEATPRELLLALDAQAEDTTIIDTRQIAPNQKEAPNFYYSLLQLRQTPRGEAGSSAPAGPRKGDSFVDRSRPLQAAMWGRSPDRRPRCLSSRPRGRGHRNDCFSGRSRPLDTRCSQRGDALRDTAIRGRANQTHGVPRAEGP